MDLETDTKRKDEDRKRENDDSKFKLQLIIIIDKLKRPREQTSEKDRNDKKDYKVNDKKITIRKTSTYLL
jgi:hypothetical protein